MRGHLARKAYAELKFSAIILQSGLLARAARDEFRYRKQRKAAIVIQAHWRTYIAVTSYKKLKKASVISQLRWRGRTAKKEPGTLKMAANEVDALQETWGKLEKQEDCTLQQFGRSFGTDPEEEESQEIIKYENSLHFMQIKVDQSNKSLVKQQEAAGKVIEEVLSAATRIPVTIQESDKIDSLIAEGLLLSEKQRADYFEKKWAEASESSEGRRKKLEEVEKRVLELQESLNRMIFSMSDQFSGLKTILHTLLNSRSTSGPTARDDPADATSRSSDSTSTDSDFTFPAPTTSVSPQENQPLGSDSFDTMVHNLSAADIPGSDKRELEHDREGVFDDFF